MDVFVDYRRGICIAQSALKIFEVNCSALYFTQRVALSITSAASRAREAASLVELICTSRSNDTDAHTFFLSLLESPCHQLSTDAFAMAARVDGEAGEVPRLRSFALHVSEGSADRSSQMLNQAHTRPHMVKKPISPLNTILLLRIRRAIRRQHLHRFALAFHRQQSFLARRLTLPDPVRQPYDFLAIVDGFCGNDEVLVLGSKLHAEAFEPVDVHIVRELMAVGMDVVAEEVVVEES